MEKTKSEKETIKIAKALHKEKLRKAGHNPKQRLNVVNPASTVV